MERKTIIFGAIIVVLLLAVGVIIGREYRKREEIDMAVERLSQEIEKLEDKVDATEDLLDDAMDDANAANKELSIIKDDLVESDKKVVFYRTRAANRVSPSTLEEANVQIAEQDEYIVALEGDKAKLTSALAKSEEQTARLREVDLFNKDIIASQDTQLDIWEKKYNIIKKKSKKEHRQKILSNVLIGLGSLGTGIAVGKATN